MRYLGDNELETSRKTKGDPKSLEKVVLYYTSADYEPDVFDCLSGNDITILEKRYLEVQADAKLLAEKLVEVQAGAELIGEKYLEAQAEIENRRCSTLRWECREKFRDEMMDSRNYPGG